MNKDCLAIEPLRKLFISIIDANNNRLLLSKLPSGIKDNIIRGYTNMVLINYNGGRYWVNLLRDNKTILIEKYTGVFEK